MQPLSNGTCGADGWAGGTSIKYSGPSGDPRFRSKWLLVVGSKNSAATAATCTQLFLRPKRKFNPEPQHLKSQAQANPTPALGWPTTSWQLTSTAPRTLRGLLGGALQRQLLRITPTALRGLGLVHKLPATRPQKAGD